MMPLPPRSPAPTFDDHDKALLANVRPDDWTNPEPARRYHLVVLGAGTAGLVTAAIAAGLGAKVALLEKHRMGGDCLNVGCVPSKALLRAARAAADVRDAGAFGIRVPEGWSVDFARVMSRLRRLRAEMSPLDSAARYRELGVDVFFGEGRFTGTKTVEVAGRVLRFARAAICTGTRPTVPAIPGLAESGFLTNETVFDLNERPARLAVIGGGPIGCELAQAFARLGTSVTLFQRSAELLPRDDPDAAAVVREQLGRDGVRVLLRSEILRVETHGRGRSLICGIGESREERVVDAILVATGRTPNLEGIGLEAAGVDHDDHGVKVDDFLRTRNRRVYAAGDVAGRFRFTHAADAQARLLVRNALFRGRERASQLVMPWCTYTDPELARVGLSLAEAEARRILVRTFVQPLAHVDRARLDGDVEGFVKVHVRHGTDRILGATAVGRNAGDWISELSLAMVGGLGLGTLGKTIHPYPTQAEAIKKLGDAHARSRLTPLVKWLSRAWLRLI